MEDRLKVVIADDEEHVREVLNNIIEYLNFDVVGRAVDGKEALSLFRKFKPDLMLLDIYMPLMTGDEVLKEILKEFPDAFIIMLTAVSDVESVKKCVKLGASHFIRKDTPIPQIMEIIKETLSKRKKTVKGVKTEKYNLAKMLEEIQKDELLSPLAEKEMSQDEIKKIVLEK